MRKITVANTLVFLMLLALDAYPGLRGGSGWRWDYELPERGIPILILAFLLTIYLAGVILIRRYNPPIGLALVWLVLAGTMIGVAVVGVRGDAGFLLFTRTVSPVQTGASTLAVRSFAEGGVQSALENWTDVMRDARAANLIHFTTSPPGQPLFHYYAAEWLQNVPFISQPVSMALRPYQCSTLEVMRYTRGELTSAGLGMLMPLWAALLVLPVYAAARMLFNHAGTGARLCAPTGNNPALHIAQWTPLIPCILLFLPTWNALYPFLCATSFALLLAGIVRGRGIALAGWCFAAGIVMSITTFFNFAVLPMLLLFGLFTLGYAVFVRPHDTRSGVVAGRPYHAIPRAIQVGLWFGMGLTTIWVAFWLVSGVTPLDILSVTFAEHAELVQRDYLPWLILHPYDVLMFTGFPLAGLFIWGMWRAFRNQLQRSGVLLGRPYNAAPQTGELAGETDSTHSPSLSAERGMGRGVNLSVIDLFALAMFLTFMLVNISGIAQGENARILSFYAPFLLLSGGEIFVSNPVGKQHAVSLPPRFWDIPLLAMQALTVLVMAAVLNAVPLDLNPQPTAPREDVPRLETAELRPVDATLTSDRYAGTIRLAAHRFIPDLIQQVITIETIWEGVEQVERPYYFELVARAENETDGEIVTEPFRWYAQNGNYLPTCWRSGDGIHDVILLPLPPVSAPVVWTLELRAVDERTGDTLRVTLPDGTTSDFITLDPVNYP